MSGIECCNMLCLSIYALKIVVLFALLNDASESLYDLSMIP